MIEESRWPRWAGFFFLAMLAFLLWGCGTGGGGTEVGNPLLPADQKLESYLKDQYARNVLPAWDGAYEVSDATSGAAAPNAAEGKSLDFSETNRQEAEVDESDKVKTDGAHLYVARQTSVDVVRTDSEGSLAFLSRVEAGGVVDSLYLREKILVVLYAPAGSASGFGDGIKPALPTVLVGTPYWLPVQAKTGLLLVDVQDPTAPKRIAAWEFDGSLVSSRLIGSKLHLVQQFLPQLPPLVTTYDGASGKEGAIRTNRERLRSISLGDLVPSYASIGPSGQPVAEGQLVAAEDFFLPEDPEGGTIVAVVTVDLGNPNAGYRSVGAVLDAHHVYASTRTLYLASQRYGAIGIADALPSETTTAIHGFDLSGEEVTYLGKGEVPGTALNQFSFGEHEGVLRVATTTGSPWGGGSRNNVYCLRPKAGVIETIGKLEDLAQGERIYSARFIGTRGFLVTYVQIDPLFTLDLSDPTAPRVAGELKVPGYSDYIHPVDENHLLTIGKDVVVQGNIAWYQGVQLSVFDVSDFAKPVLLFKQVLGSRGTESEALHDHKAFTYWAGQGLLAIPLQLAERPASATPWDYGVIQFTGVQVFRVTIEKGIEPLGRIPTDFAQWTRGLFIGANVFAVTPEVAKSARIEDIGGTIEVLDLP